MQYLKKIKKAILVESILLVSLYSVFMTDILREGVGREQPQAVEVGSVGEREYIKWVDFNVSYEALCEAYKWDVETYEEAQEDEGIVHVDWIELLAYAGARHGGKFPSGTVSESDVDRPDGGKAEKWRNDDEGTRRRYGILCLLSGGLSGCPGRLCGGI